MDNFDASDEDRYYEGLINFCRGSGSASSRYTFLMRKYTWQERWGHSTEIMAVKLALESQVKQLILGHQRFLKTMTETFLESC
jgi:hypothetical protein